MGYQKILVLQTAFLGDVILTTPTVKAIKQVFHNSQVDVLTIPQAAIVFKHNPYVNLTLIFDKKMVLTKIFNFWKIVWQLRKTKYDLALSIQSSMTSSLVMFLGNIPSRVGFSRQKQKLLTESVVHKRGLHIRKRYLYLLKPFINKFDENSFDTQSEIFWSDNENQKAQEIYSSIFKKNFSILGFAPGSVWQTKRWPKEHFIALLEMLSKEKNEKVFLEETIRKNYDLT